MKIRDMNSTKSFPSVKRIVIIAINSAITVIPCFFLRTFVVFAYNSRLLCLLFLFAFGVHVAISLDDKPGCILIKEDDFMAAMIIYQLRIVGKGGHGAKPEQCISPIKCFTYVYQAISEMYEKEYKDKLLRYSIGHVEAGQKDK